MSTGMSSDGRGSYSKVGELGGRSGARHGATAWGSERALHKGRGGNVSGLKETIPKGARGIRYVEVHTRFPNCEVSRRKEEKEYCPHSRDKTRWEQCCEGGENRILFPGSCKTQNQRKSRGLGER